ncbi:uncharacterized protein [Fopius arisanus]|uniref:Zinc finger CCHC domain-containing protein 7 n=2 Tax=Fopius arisanus TaxID=64838 RepID=A0A9R1T854_9HYME|nr:PREDICTED: uncharacterized protein LOC105267325 isoform X1 [Fopius arisanus]
MAATRNFNGVSEDMDTSLLDVDMNDPDLEARLYGEIYYSNETYPDPVPQGSPSPQVNNSTAAGTQWSIDPQPGQSGNPGESHYPRKKKHRALIDGLPGSPFSQFSRGRKPEGDENNFRNQKTWDSQRVFPRGDSPRGSPPELQKSRKSREAIPSREKMTQNTEEIMEEDEEPDSTSLTALDDAMTANTTSESSREHSTPSRSPQNTPQEDSTFQSPAESQDDRKTPEESSNSKYKVQCKKSRKNPPSMIVEDSDDSILEVPVPPKPLPPLISLQDSDESSDESPVRMDRTPQEEESSESSSLEVIDEDTTTQLIINCTSVQKGVSSLAEIKRQRKERERNPGGQSDEESMTESEALNWGSLEGEIREEGELVDTEESVEVWEGIVEESDQRRNLLDESGSSGKCSEGMPLMVAEQRVAEDKRSEGQKRAHSGGSEESPRKKKKRERSMGLQEYLFQPMPKQLRDFYNEPRGGDIMKDIKEIQNAMPKHPSRWVVLDADLYPRPRKKRNTCAICQCEGHLRSRCPERPKVPTCHVCGIVGHSEPRCPESRKCFNCGKKWSTCRRTCEHCNSLQCSQCKGKGHCIRNCPDNWRKYHQTTSGAAVNIPADLGSVLKPSHQLSCSNCTRRGHEASTCLSYRWSGHFFQSCNVRDYTAGPIYALEVPQVPQVSQLLKDTHEPIDASGLGINSIGPSTKLFYFLNSQSPDISTWKECSLIFNEPSDGKSPPDSPILPNFLRTQFKHFKGTLMEVTVKRSHALQRLVITLKTPDSSTLEKLKELVLQWMMRSRDDQETMNKIKRLPMTYRALVRALIKEFNNFMCRAVSNKIWLNRRMCPALEKNTAEKTRDRASGNSLRTMQLLGNLKFGRVVATYKYMLIGTPGDVLKPFWKFLKVLQDPPGLQGDSIPADVHIKAVWYCFELFTPHLSPSVLNALEACRGDPTSKLRGERAFKEFTLQVKRSGMRFRKDQPKLPSIVDVPIPPPEEFSISPGCSSKPLKRKTTTRKKDKPMKPAPFPGTRDMNQPKGSAKVSREIKRDQQRAAEKKRKRKRKESSNCSRNERIVTPDVVAENTKKALDCNLQVKEKNMKDIETKCGENLEGNGVDNKRQLINMWNDIRNHSIKRDNKRIS